MAQADTERLMEVAVRIRELRDILGISIREMAQKTEVSEEVYLEYESGTVDLPFTFIHKCSLAFDVGITDLLEGREAHLSSYTVTRKGHGQETAKEDGIEIRNLAPMFLNKISEPYYVRYEYKEELLHQPIHTTTHYGQEFDYVLSGRMKIQVGDNIEYLSEGDSIYYNSATPHGMIAVDGQDCLFLAMILPGEKQEETIIRNTMLRHIKTVPEVLVSDQYVECEEDENGALQHIRFKNTERFNFAFDIVDELGRKKPDKLAMIHVAEDKTERRFTFYDIKRASSQAANYFRAIGIKKGDKVMLVLKRRYEFWFAILGLHKIGAIAIPATAQLQAHDFEYRFKAAEVNAVLCAGDEVALQAEIAEVNYDRDLLKIFVGGKREGWRDFDEEYQLYSSHCHKNGASAGGNDP
ncbi:MAG: AMP-binding protein, partial [Lachnospiraceae bacterium]|nr:AMP-binding protein [Lachnospiraceae bacterium]